MFIFDFLKKRKRQSNLDKMRDIIKCELEHKGISSDRVIDQPNSSFVIDGIYTILIDESGISDFKDGWVKPLLHKPRITIKDIFHYILLDRPSRG